MISWFMAGWLLAAHAWANESGEAFGPMVKHRVVVVMADAPVAGEHAVAARLSHGADTEKLPPDLRRQAMTGADLLKAALSESPRFRVVELAGNAKSGNQADLRCQLAVAYETSATLWRITLQVMDAGSDVVLGVYSLEAGDLRAAIASGVERMGRERALNAMVWEVVQVTADGGVVLRGLDDGLKVGHRLNGFRRAANAAPEADREVALLTSKPLGQYEITLARGGVSLWRTVGTAPALIVGDLLEVPSLRLRVPDEGTRARDIQDALYKK